MAPSVSINLFVFNTDLIFHTWGPNRWTSLFNISITETKVSNMSVCAHVIMQLYLKPAQQEKMVMTVLKLHDAHIYISLPAS